MDFLAFWSEAQGFDVVFPNVGSAHSSTMWFSKNALTECLVILFHTISPFKFARIRDLSVW